MKEIPSPRRGEASVPPGIRILELVGTRGADILGRERGNGRQVHLYDAGGYRIAFERSAWLLCLLFPRAEVMTLHLGTHPFPVVLAAVREDDVRPYFRRHIVRTCGDRSVLLAPSLPSEGYDRWRREVVDGAGEWTCKRD